MAHSRETEHYQLPLYDGTDIINPLTDFNNANEKIDEVLYDANERSVEAKEASEAAAQSIGQYDDRISAAEATANNAIVIAEKTQHMIGDEFDPLKNDGYKAGDIVVYQNKVWEFINPHNGAWDGADVKETTIGSIINDIVDEVVTFILANIGDTLNSINTRITSVENELNRTKVELMSESEG